MEPFALGVVVEELCLRDTFVTGTKIVETPLLQTCSRKNGKGPFMSQVTFSGLIRSLERQSEPEDSFVVP